MIELETIGFELLTTKTKDEFQVLFEEFSKKIERKLRNVKSFKIHIKEYSPGGKVKYSIHAILDYSGKVIEADASDWDLKKTVHKVFHKIEEQAEHLFHISDQNKGNNKR
jgi:ribosome-associated translation inhibitor RaiA